MDYVVASRFACLKPDQGDKKAKNNPAKKDETTWKKLEPKTKNSTKEAPSKESIKKTDKIKQRNSLNKKEKKNKQVAAAEQWEEWKAKDDQLLDGYFEEELASAIILSKLDYEKNKELYEKYKKETEEANNKVNNKKRKTKVMSLDQFLASLNKNGISEKSVPKQETQDTEEDFFKTCKDETEEQLTKEQKSQKQKTNIIKLKDKKSQRHVSIDEIITSSQFHEKLEIVRKKNDELTEELEKAKEEIVAVKTRNKTLCAMLATGEMKEKADVLSELEKLTTIKNDLTEEVARLHVLLEQERSKVAAVSTENKYRDKGKK